MYAKSKVGKDVADWLMRNQGWWRFLEQRSNVGKEGSGGGRRGRGGVGEGEKPDILNKRVIVIIGNSGDFNPWLKVGRHHGGGSGSKECVYNKRRFEGYFELHFKRN